MSDCAPLTPPDCDLRDFAFMPLDVSRLRDSDLAATAEGDAFRAAVLLWCAAWHQVPAASLPNDDKVLAFLAGFGRDIRNWKKFKVEAMRGFVLCTDGRYYHPHVADKALEAWGSRGKFAEKREKDRERLTAWREAKRERNAFRNDDETDVKRVSKRDGNANETSKTGDRGQGTVESPPKPSVSSKPPTLPADVRSVMEEGGFISPPPDLSLLTEWYELARAMFGQSPEQTLAQDILPTVRAVRARLSKAPFKLKVFDAAIREKLAADEAEIAHLRKVAARNAEPDQPQAVGG